MEKLEQGSIVWAEVDDPRGANPKRRPIVIITHTDEIVLDGDIVGVAITTSYSNPPGSEHVELPWCLPRHPATALARRSAANCKWLVTLKPSQVRELRGYVPQKYLLEILSKIRLLHGLDSENNE